MTSSTPFAKVFVLIRTSLRPGADLAAYEAMNARMEALVSQIPGYLGIKGYTSEDGDSVAIAQFESHDALLRWRNHPEHREAQRAGRERFYATYDVRVCTVERAYDFSLERKPRRTERNGSGQKSNG
jgi:heme-degrading monooxygenase HmoA